MIVVLFILLVLMDYEMEHQKVVGVKQKIEYIHIDGNRYSLSEFCEKHNLSYGAAWQNFRRNNRNEELLIKYLLRKCKSV